MPLWSPRLQQDRSIYALRHTLEEECLAMLNPLKNNFLVLKVPEEVGQMLIRGVKGQLGEGQDGRTRIVEEGFGYVEQHGQGAVSLAWQR